jgi:hypothetical protein
MFREIIPQTIGVALLAFVLVVGVLDPTIEFTGAATRQLPSVGMISCTSAQQRSAKTMQSL